MSGPAGVDAAGAEVQAQAKVNLRLRILAREASGFHQIETLFLRLALSDTVRVHRSAARSLDVAGLSAKQLGAPEQNLAWRAAVAYVDAGAWSGGFSIELEKRIPVGGGLGGGSADAGAVLRAMDSLSVRPLGPAALLRLATSLGADVPFLTSEHAYALAWGRGERMLALDPPETRPVTLIVPSFSVNTAAAYGWLAAARAAAPGPALPGVMLNSDSLRDWDALGALATNDFQPVVTERHPEISQLVAGLRESGCPVAMMSGSGSVVFGVCPRGVASVGTTPTRDDSDPVRYTRIMTASADRVEPVRLLD